VLKRHSDLAFLHVTKDVRESVAVYPKRNLSKVKEEKLRRAKYRYSLVSDDLSTLPNVC